MFFIRSIVLTYIQCGNFGGRSGRWSIFFWVIYAYSVGFLTPIALRTLGASRGEFDFAGNIFLVWVLISLIPNYALIVRRLHDSNRSGWWLFVILFPVVGIIYFFYLMLFAVDKGDNKYGRASPLK